MIHDQIALERTPTVEQARAFCAVAVSSTYREAAERLGLSDHIPVIRRVGRFTQAMARGRLVTAHYTGQVELTAAGHDAYPLARRLVQASDALVRSGRESVRIRFSAYPAIVQRLAREVPALLEQLPIELYDVSDATRRDRGRGLVQRTADGEIDLVVAPAHPDVSGLEDLEEEVLYRWRLRAILPKRHPLRVRDHVAPRELTASGLNVVGAPRGHHSRELLEAAYASDRLPLAISFVSTNQVLLIEIARNSNGLAAVLPDDAEGKPDADLGPELTLSDGSPLSGLYSLYYRRAGTTRDEIIADVAGAIRASFR